MRCTTRLRIITGLVLAACIIPNAVLAQGGQVPPVREGLISLRLTADKIQYSAGQPIRLRLTMTNTSDGNLIVDLQPPSWLTELEIRDKTGQIVAPSPLGGAGGRGSMAASYRFAPGQSVVAQFYPPNGAAPSGWQDITWWGYTLAKPGVYTIVAIPTFRALLIRPGGTKTFAVSGVDRSNEIRITIAP